MVGLGLGGALYLKIRQRQRCGVVCQASAASALHSLAAVAVMYSTVVTNKKV